MFKLLAGVKVIVLRVMNRNYLGYNHAICSLLLLTLFCTGRVTLMDFFVAYDTKVENRAALRTPKRFGVYCAYLLATATV